MNIKTRIAELRCKLSSHWLARTARLLFGICLAYLLIRYTLAFTGVDFGSEVGAFDVPYLIA